MSYQETRLRIRTRTLTTLLVLALLAGFPLSAVAEEDQAQTGDAVTTLDRHTDRVTDRPTDKPSDRPTDKPIDRPTDKPSDRPIDRCDPRLTDHVRRCLDRPTTDRPVNDCLRQTDNPRRCISDDHSDHINIRHLIWRLIHAHEWEKLVRLLLHLGWL